jgi:hypothetical protein
MTTYYFCPSCREQFELTNTDPLEFCPDDSTKLEVVATAAQTIAPSKLSTDSTPISTGRNLLMFRYRITPVLPGNSENLPLKR